MELISEEHQADFNQMHSVSWEESHQISTHFQLEKQQKFFNDITAENKFNIVYFDAFGARVQP